jgi:cobalt-precorrin 5A hydrolase
MNRIATTSHASLAVGIGCRRGVSADDIEQAVKTALGDAFALADIACIASIEARRDEAGLHAFCARHRLALRFYEADDIARVTLSHASPHTQKYLHVDGVCVPCALLASASANANANASAYGHIIIGKTNVGNVSVAIARTSFENPA